MVPESTVKENNGLTHIKRGEYALPVEANRAYKNLFLRFYPTLIVLFYFLSERRRKINHLFFFGWAAMAEEQKTTKVDVESPAVSAPEKEPAPAPVEASTEVAEEKVHDPPPPVESKALAVVESKLL